MIAAYLIHRRSKPGDTMIARQVDIALGKRLLLARLAAAQSHLEIANALGLCEQRIAAMEQGRMRIGALEIARFSRYFGRSVSWFYEGFPGQSLFERVRNRS